LQNTLRAENMLEKAGRWDARNARRREQYAQDPLYRAKENARRSAYYQAHKRQSSERSRSFREAHKEEINKRARDRYHAHKHDNASPVRTAQLKHLYGISPAEYDALLAKQGGTCAICRKRPKGRLCVDHCHLTGTVRGLLCNGCNSALGWLKDDQASLVAALAYLGTLPHDGTGSAARRALAVHDVLPPLADAPSDTDLSACSLRCRAGVDRESSSGERTVGPNIAPCPGCGAARSSCGAVHR
jgi:Recombination endonuclease VII